MAVARPIVKVLASELAVWFASPAKSYEAPAVPAFVLFVYVAAGVRWRLPAPVTETVHGVWAWPVYVTLGGQVTTVEEAAGETTWVQVSAALEAWFASPP